MCSTESMPVMYWKTVITVTPVWNVLLITDWFFFFSLHSTWSASRQQRRNLHEGQKKKPRVIGCMTEKNRKLFWWTFKLQRWVPAVRKTWARNRGRKCVWKCITHYVIIWRCHYDSNIQFVNFIVLLMPVS